MMLGCGYCVKTIRRGRYLYFWHYEDRGGRREQVEEYVGAAADQKAREEVSRRLAAYVERARSDLGRFVRQAQVELSAVS